MLDAGERDGGTLRPRLWPVALVLVALYTPFVVARLAEHDAYWFAHVGRQMLHSSDASSELTPALGWQSEIGYDGQYYYALAVDPRHADDYMPDGIAGIVYSRPFFPLLAGTLGATSKDAVPYAMLALNLLAVGVGTLALAAWLRRRRVSPWFALLYGLFPGLVFAVFRDLTEPLAFALVTLAALALDRRTRGALVLAAALFALAGLTRETTLVFAAGAAVALLGASWRRNLPRAVLFLAGSIAPLLVWRVVVGHFVTGPTQERGDGLRALIPFHGLADYWPWDTEHVLILMSVVVPTVFALIGVPGLLRRWSTRGVGVALVLSAAGFVVFLPSGVDVDYGAAGRAAIAVVLATLAGLPAWSIRGRPSRYGVTAAFLWSLPWYALVATGLGISAVTPITS